MPNFTPEDLLLYQAGELSEEQSATLAEELKINWALHEKLIVLTEAIKRINSIKLDSPRRQTVQSIMRYAMRKPATV